MPAERELIIVTEEHSVLAGAEQEEEQQEEIEDTHAEDEVDKGWHSSLGVAAEDQGRGSIHNHMMLQKTPNLKRSQSKETLECQANSVLRTRTQLIQVICCTFSLTHLQSK